MSLFLSFLIGNHTVEAKANKTSSEAFANAVMVSIYDDMNDTYLMQNTKVEYNNELTVLQTFEKLKEKKLIKDYVSSDTEVNSVTINDNLVFHAGTLPYNMQFYFKINGIMFDQTKLSAQIKNGDIVEWIFAKQSDQAEINSITENTSENTAKVSSILWDQSQAKKMNLASDWLNRNREDSDSYLLCFGIAGKTANTKQVNDLIADITKEQEFASATEISKRILKATFCGFDSSSSKYGQLVTKLSTYPNIMKQGIFGAVNALTAYDSNQYDISSSALNSRKMLVDQILTFQQSDGGFSITKDGKSDIDTTAMTLTALSFYQDRDDVCESINRAILFLEESQTKTGGFGFNGQENAESLSTVIIALNSLGIKLDDKRFAVGSKSLFDLLMEYQNSDGGFAHIKGSESTVMPTEQAIIAMASTKKEGNPYRLTTLVNQQREEIPTENTQLISENKSVILIAAIIAIVVIGIIVIVVAHKMVNKKSSDTPQKE